MVKPWDDDKVGVEIRMDLNLAQAPAQLGATATMTSYQQEIFGPVLQVIRVETMVFRSGEAGDPASPL